jgi:hypothetical protein
VPAVPDVAPAPPLVSFAFVSMNWARADPLACDPDAAEPAVPVPLVPAVPPAVSAFCKQPVTVTCLLVELF